MAKPILVANWKNYPGSLAEAKSLIKQLSKDRASYKNLAIFIAPPLTYLDTVSEYIPSFARLASQDISLLDQGTHTGVVTPEILKSFGTRLSIIGHSERRELGETSEEISKKIRIAIRSGIAPLVCIGEKTRDADGEHFEFLRQQIEESLSGLNKNFASKLAVAYEPVWAIGSRAKEAIDPADLSQSVIFIKKVLADMFGRKTAEGIPILYGGSIDVSNATGLASVTGIRGFLVGRASLNAKTFKEIAKSLTSK